MMQFWIPIKLIDIIASNEPVPKQKILKKCGGLSFIDIDEHGHRGTPQVQTIDVEDLHFSRERKDKGWQIVAHHEWCDRLVDPEAHDLWSIKPLPDGSAAALHDCIVECYQKYPDPSISIVEKASTSDKSDSDKSDDND